LYFQNFEGIFVIHLTQHNFCIERSHNLTVS